MDPFHAASSAPPPEPVDALPGSSSTGSRTVPQWRLAVFSLILCFPSIFFAWLFTYTASDLERAAVSQSDLLFAAAAIGGSLLPLAIVVVPVTVRQARRLGVTVTWRLTLGMAAFLGVAAVEGTLSLLAAPHAEVLDDCLSTPPIGAGRLFVVLSATVNVTLGAIATTDRKFSDGRPLLATCVQILGLVTIFFILPKYGVLPFLTDLWGAVVRPLHTCE